MENILGQSHAIHLLQASLRSGRVHHAFIFHGPQGVGKFTTAVAFAGVLLCHNPRTSPAGKLERCGTCPSCRYTTHPEGPQNHPDLHVVRKELAAVSSNAELRKRKLMNIPIDLLRELVVGGTSQDRKFHEAPAYLTPSLRHHKVFIIDEAELLDKPGASALLKTLEEPPTGTFLILVTEAEDKLLPTIRSRCQRVGFVPLEDDVIRHWVSQHNAGLSEQDQDRLVTIADGSFGRAKLALDYGLHEWAATILPALDDMARGRFSPTLGAQLTEMIGGFASQWVKDKDHPGASKEAANRRAASLVWSLIARHARTRLHQTAATCDPADPDASWEKVARWLGVIEALRLAERELKANLNVNLVCDHVVSLINRSLVGAPAFAGG